jgi:hypothetical protein
MAKPRVFISSTYYDLRHIRKGIESFVEEIGYEAIMFESGDIPFSHDRSLDHSCYREIGSSHILVLIIGGKFGSQISDSNIRLLDKDEMEGHYQHYNSITERELNTAIEKDIPVYIFVEKGVSAEYETFKRNRDKTEIRYAHVDSVNVFRLLDGIYKRKRNNLTREFENLDDIISWLRDQWAGLLAEFLAQKVKESSLKTLELRLTELKNVTESLKSYSQTLIREVTPDSADRIIQEADVIMHEKTVRDAAERSGFIRHLIAEHHGKIDNIIAAIQKSTTMTDLITNLAPVSCGSLRSLSGGVLEELQTIRQVMDLPPLEIPKPVELAREARDRRKDRPRKVINRQSPPSNPPGRGKVSGREL